jgi:hypothetical protein
MEAFAAKTTVPSSAHSVEFDVGVRQSNTEEKFDVLNHTDSEEPLDLNPCFD